MHAPLVPMLFPILSPHMSGSEFQYSDLIWKELYGIMTNQAGINANICRLPEPSRAHSRYPHLQPPESLTYS